MGARQRGGGREDLFEIWSIAGTMDHRQINWF